MATVSFYPDGKIIDVKAGTTILQAAREASIVIESPCNAIGTCGKCKVRISQESRENVIQHGRHRLSDKEEHEGWVLSCQAEITGDIVVEEILASENKSLKILNHGTAFDIQLAPHIHKSYEESTGVTVVKAGGRPIAREPGNTARFNYGVVVDIGTTTLVASLVDVTTAKEIYSVSALNPQAIHAQDVLSRIKYASEEDGLRVMTDAIINELNRLIGELTTNTGIQSEHIYEVVFSGNTCMLHLAANVNPSSLGKYPYIPEVTGGSYLNAAEHRLRISPHGVIYLPPIISAYVGADITSGILAAQLYEKKGTTLFVDIGTNGEMVIGLDGKLSATSTAAGPAFEGMNITFGMRAGKGAIELFNVEEDGSIQIKTIGESEPEGICGSGLLDIVGELVAYGVINQNGKLANPGDESILPPLRDRLEKRDNKTVFKVSEKVFLSQKDIRQVQLAKGAVRAGIEFLLSNKGVSAAAVDKVLIAGSFGYHLRAKSLMNIGLLPLEFEGKIEFIGNSSKSGGHGLLLNESYREKMKEVVQEVEVVELANYQDFDKVFVKSLNF